MITANPIDNAQILLREISLVQKNKRSARFKLSLKLRALGSHPFYRAPTPPLAFVEYSHRIPVGCSAHFYSYSVANN